MINNRKLFAARKIYFFEVIAYLYRLNHLSWEIKTNENAFEKKGKYYNQFIIKLSAESTQDAHSGKKTRDSPKKKLGFLISRVP